MGVRCKPPIFEFNHRADSTGHLRRNRRLGASVHLSRCRRRLFTKSAWCLFSLPTYLLAALEPALSAELTVGLEPTTHDRGDQLSTVALPVELRADIRGIRHHYRVPKRFLWRLRPGVLRRPLGATGRTRTHAPRLKRPMLCQLSY